MKKDFKCIIIVFLLSFIPRVIIAVQMMPYLVYDEGPTMAMAAYLAGKDWSNAMQGAAYYGFGYYIFFAPIFAITDDPYIIYRVICIVNSVIQAGYGVIAYICVSRFIGNKENYKDNMIISIVCSYLVVIRVQVYNEIGLILITWLVALLLCFLIKADNELKKDIISICIWGIALYGMTIHTRAVILIIALVILIVLYGVLYREYLFSKKSFVILILGYVFFKYIIKCVQNLLWRTDSGNLHNASINVTGHIGNFDFTDIDAWRAIIYTFIGQINALNMFTGGLFLLSIITIIMYVIKSNDYKSDMFKCNLVIFVTFFIALVGMIMGQAITWGDGVYESLNNGLNNQDVYKSFTYVRYAGAYMAPLILCGIAGETFNMMNKRVNIFIVVLVSGLIHLYWLINIVPLISESLITFEVFTPLALRKPRQSINYDMYLHVTAWFILLTTIFVIFIIIKKKKLYMSMIIVYLCFQFLYTGYYNDVFYGEDHSQMAMKSYELLQTVKKDNKEFKFDTIYMYNGDYMREQFYFNNLDIIQGIPEKKVDNAILLYEGDLKNDIEFEKSIDSDDYNVVQLDDIRFLLVKGEMFSECIEKSGYNILELNELM